jgi:hypothetical protein
VIDIAPPEFWLAHGDRLAKVQNQYRKCMSLIFSVAEIGKDIAEAVHFAIVEIFVNKLLMGRKI